MLDLDQALVVPHLRVVEHRAAFIDPPQRRAVGTEVGLQLIVAELRHQRLEQRTQFERMAAAQAA